MRPSNCAERVLAVCGACVFVGLVIACGGQGLHLSVGPDSGVVSPGGAGSAGGTGGGGGTGGRGGAGGSGGTGGRGGAWGADDPNCHYDCFGGIGCSDGVVSSQYAAPVPCGSWTGRCPSQLVGTCQRGCASEWSSATGCPLTICRENQPKQPGDPCAAEADCHPNEAVPTSGGASRTYLRCDVELGICVNADAPELEDWLGPCDPTLVSQLNAGSHGAISDPSCSGGLCVFSVPRDQDCVQQGCSRPCALDEECPQGAVCQTPDYCQRAAEPRGYCKPGARDLFGVGLPCL
jgi:hypothetical protein